MVQADTQKQASASPRDLASLRHLDDVDLVARLRNLAAREREATVELVAHLAELDTRDIHLRAGYPSLFVYCRDVLGLSEHEAYNRIEAARAVRRFPVILDLLAEGKIHLTTVRLLAPHLTPDNYQRVLDSARGKRKAEVEEIVARTAPRPDAAPVLRKLPTPRIAPPVTAEAREEGAPPLPIPPREKSSQNSSPRDASPPPAVTPLSPDRYLVRFTIGGSTLEKLERVKDLLRHSVPTGDTAAIFDRALEALLADLVRKKLAATGYPRPSAGAKPGSRHVPAEVRRDVWRRDQERCAFVGTGGQRCRERAFLEFHHVKPYAIGGEATVTNVELRCRRHNQHEARVYFRESRAYVIGPPSGQLVLERVGK
jgi:hypothetical protein